MTNVVVYSGTGRYTDPWHPFEQTSAALADIARGLGWDAEVRPSELGALAHLGGVDLVVVNSGGGDPSAPPAPDADWRAEHEGLERFITDGGAVYAVHTAANTFPDWPEWTGWLGGCWVRGQSMHPERCYAVFEPAPGSHEHPVFSGLPPVADVASESLGPCVLCYDERYSKLDVHTGSRPLLRHETGEEFQVCAWVNEADGVSGRVLYDGLGHDHRSYESASRRRFAANAMTYLVGQH